MTYEQVIYLYSAEYIWTGWMLVTVLTAYLNWLLPERVYKEFTIDDGIRE
jgi:hypothetical protein